MNTVTKIQLYHGNNQTIQNALDILLAVQSTEYQTVFETRFSLMETVKILSDYCRTVAIFSDKDGNNKWVAVTYHRNFCQR